MSSPLIGIPAMAERYGLARETIRKYRRWGYLPAEYTTVSGTPVWLVKDVDEWAKKRGYKIDRQHVG